MQPPEQPPEQPPPQEPTPKPKRSKRFWLVLAVSVLAVIAIAAALYFFVFNKNTNPNTYKYSKLDSYSLTKGLSGSGITFEKPVELKVSYKSTTSVVLGHNLASKKLVSYVAAAVTPLARPLFANDLQNYNQVLANPSNKYYTQTVRDIQLFTQNNFSRSTKKVTTVNFANAKKFTNANIKSNAWVFDFTAADSIEKSQNTGEVVFAIAPKGYYYFLSYATDPSWQPNQKVWNQVFNSLKIDQN